MLRLLFQERRPETFGISTPTPSKEDAEEESVGSPTRVESPGITTPGNEEKGNDSNDDHMKVGRSRKEEFMKSCHGQLTTLYERLSREHDRTHGDPEGASGDEYS